MRVPRGRGFQRRWEVAVTCGDGGLRGLVAAEAAPTASLRDLPGEPRRLGGRASVEQVGRVGDPRGGQKPGLELGRVAAGGDALAGLGRNLQSAVIE